MNNGPMYDGDVRFWMVFIAVASYLLGWLRGRWTERDKHKP